MGTNTKQCSALNKHNRSTTDDRKDDGDESENNERHDESNEPANDEHDEHNESEEELRMVQIDGNVSLSSEASCNYQNQIPIHITNRGQPFDGQVRYGPQNLHRIQRSNKLSHTVHLPKLCNINPQSIYNKKDEFITFVEEMVLDVIFISESWERSNITLEEIMRPLQNHTVVSNVHQREGRGGRPALVVNSQKYQVQNITQSIISIPWGVEAVWALITPKGVQSDSIIQRIVLGSVYLTTAARSHVPLLDHITDVYNILSTKYPKGL